MKTQIAIGGFFFFLSLLCLGHMGQLVPILPQTWFLMFVGASAAISYAALGYLLIRDAIKSNQEWLATQNRRRPTGTPLTAILRKVGFGK